MNAKVPKLRDAISALQMRRTLVDVIYPYIVLNENLVTFKYGNEFVKDWYRIVGIRCQNLYDIQVNVDIYIHDRNGDYHFKPTSFWIDINNLYTIADIEEWLSNMPREEYIGRYSDKRLYENNIQMALELVMNYPGGIEIDDGYQDVTN